MFGDNFILKAMIAIFSVPLVAHADINIDFKPLTEFVSSQSGMAGVETEHLVTAAKTLSQTATMNAPAPATEEEAEAQKTDKLHLAELLGQIEKISKQAERDY